MYDYEDDEELGVVSRGRGNPNVFKAFEEKQKEMSQYEENLKASMQATKSAQTRKQNIKYKNAIKQGLQDILTGQYTNGMTVGEEYLARVMANELANPSAKGLMAIAKITGDLVDKVEISTPDYEQFILQKEKDEEDGK